MKAILTDELLTSVTIEKQDTTTSPMGGSTPDGTRTTVTTTTALVQEMSAEEVTEAGLTGEKRMARIFLTEYVTLQPRTHFVVAGSNTWVVLSVTQLAGSHTEAVGELISDG